MDKLKMMSMDKVSENIEKIKALFPNCVTEVKRGEEVEQAIDFDVLKQELSKDLVDEREERYQMTWPDKKKSVVLANSPINKTLRPCREESVDFDNTENLYIEGDNLEVLKLLQETYLGKIKMIYIDPPYNTGNDSFVYNDVYSMSEEEFLSAGGYYDEDGNRVIDVKENNESNGRFHTDWLNMIYPRLRLARDLLSDDGVIFISIDDNEQANLKKVCDEIFGEDNFIISIAWRRTDNQPNIGKVARVKEHILCFCKNINKLLLGKMPLSEKAKNEYRYRDNVGIFRRAILLDKTRGRYRYNIKTGSGKILEGPWMIKEKEFYDLDKNGGVYWTSGGDEQPYGKIYLKDSTGQIPNDFWGIEFGTNQRASLEVENIFERRIFDFPKPVSLIETIIKLGSQEDSIILDFFSGSATTAHAVMQLNAEDGGKRKFIMVQLPEACDEKSEAYKAGYKNICEIGKERIRRAGKKIKEESPLTTQNLDTGFRVLKLDSSNMLDVYYNPSEVEQTSIFDYKDNIKADRSAEDLLFQIMLDMGVTLSAKIEEKEINGTKVFAVDGDFLVACFADNLTDDTLTEIAKLKPRYAAFRDSSFANDSVAKNCEQIFATYSPNTKCTVV